MLSGQLVGVAYGGLGAASVWLSIHALWCVQWAAFCGLWTRITPEAIQAMHVRLAEEETARQSEIPDRATAQRDASLQESLLRPSGGSE